MSEARRFTAGHQEFWTSVTDRHRGKTVKFKPYMYLGTRISGRVPTFLDHGARLAQKIKFNPYMWRVSSITVIELALNARTFTRRESKSQNAKDKNFLSFLCAGNFTAGTIIGTSSLNRCETKFLHAKEKYIHSLHYTKKNLYLARTQS